MALCMENAPDFPDSPCEESSEFLGRGKALESSLGPKIESSHIFQMLGVVEHRLREIEVALRAYRPDQVDELNELKAELQLLEAETKRISKMRTLGFVNWRVYSKSGTLSGACFHFMLEIEMKMKEEVREPHRPQGADVANCAQAEPPLSSPSHVTYSSEATANLRGSQDVALDPDAATAALSATTPSAVKLIAATTMVADTALAHVAASPLAAAAGDIDAAPFAATAPIIVGPSIVAAPVDSDAAVAAAASAAAAPVRTIATIVAAEPSALRADRGRPSHCIWTPRADEPALPRFPTAFGSSAQCGSRAVQRGSHDVQCGSCASVGEESEASSPWWLGHTPRAREEAQLHAPASRETKRGESRLHALASTETTRHESRLLTLGLLDTMRGEGRLQRPASLESTRGEGRVYLPAPWETTRDDTCLHALGFRETTRGEGHLHSLAPWETAREEAYMQTPASREAQHEDGRLHRSASWGTSREEARWQARVSCGSAREEAYLHAPVSRGTMRDDARLHMPASSESKCDEALLRASACKEAMHEEVSWDVRVVQRELAEFTKALKLAAEDVCHAGGKRFREVRQDSQRVRRMLNDTAGLEDEAMAAAEWVEAELKESLEKLKAFEAGYATDSEVP